VAPFVVYGALMLVMTLFLTTPKARYSASLLPVLFVLASASLARLTANAKPALRVALALVIPYLLALNLVIADRVDPFAPDPGSRLDDRVVAALQPDFGEARLILPRYYLPIVKWYLPRARLLSRDSPGDLVAAAASWRPDAVLYVGPRDRELEAALIAARGVEEGESLTVSGGSLQVTLLRFGGGGPWFAELDQDRVAPPP
jgi:hypothetical protein